MSDDENVEYNLVLPFVACRSQGGAYDDDAFVAGYRCALVDRWLEDGRHDLANEHPQPPALLAQLDLIAMSHGYTMRSEPWPEAPDEWALVAFDRVES